MILTIEEIYSQVIIVILWLPDTYQYYIGLLENHTLLEKHLNSIYSSGKPAYK